MSCPGICRGSCKPHSRSGPEARSACEYPYDDRTPWVSIPSVRRTRRSILPDWEAQMKIAAMFWATGFLVYLPAAPAVASSCDSLATLAMKDTTVTLAQLVPAGQFSAPAERQGAAR